jgi:hypothetical protein
VAFLPHKPSNVAIMSMFQTYLMGLAVAHLAWFHFFTAGQLLRSRVPDESDSFSLADLIITSVAAMALSGFGLLFLGFARLLNHFGMLIALDLAERGSEGRRA